MNTKKILNYKSSDLNIFFFGVPTHNNLGDIAQTVGIRNFLKDKYSKFNVVEFNTPASFSKKFIKYFKKKIKVNDLIVFQGGYTSHEFHPDHKMHKILIRIFNSNKIIFFPQTFNITSKSELVNTKKIFESHQRLLIMARDKISYDKFKSNFPSVSLILIPDISLYNYNSFNIPLKNSINRSKILFLLRDDGELYYGRNIIKNKTLDTFPGDLNKFIFSDTNLTRKEIKNKNWEDLLINKLTFYSQFNLIVTDRFHGTIFAFLSNTPVVVLKTNFFKVNTGASWLKSESQAPIFIVESLHHMIELIKDFKNRNIDESIYNQKFYCKNPFANLKENIDLL
jgi:exopolysaccharide biosynthesis predicted pyruvyltransferase EpsI